MAGRAGGAGGAGSNVIDEARRRFAVAALPALLPCLPAGRSRARDALLAKPPDERDYASKIAAARRRRTRTFAAGDDPIPKAKHAEFLPLAYFPIDPDYNVPAALKPIDDQTIYRDADVDRRQPQDAARRHAGVHAEGPADDADARSSSSAPIPDRCSSPFSDLTNGTETYAAGRFWISIATPTGIYELDFNRAYIPYCYYNPTFECPLPPPENRLKIPVRAGER